MTWIGTAVKVSKSAGGTEVPVIGPAAVGMEAGTSPAGNTQPTGSYDTMARMFSLLGFVSHPGRPLAECVTSTPGPIFANRAATASASRALLPGPVSGVCWRHH